MVKIKDTKFHKEAIQELNYPFGDFFLFENFVISEIKEDVVFTWENHAKKVVQDIAELYDDNGKNIVYISNRVNNYSVVPSDWLKFFKYSYSLKGYAVVSNNRNSILEKLFMKSKMKSFKSIETAVLWAKEIIRKDQNKDKISA